MTRYLITKLAVLAALAVASLGPGLQRLLAGGTTRRPAAA